MRLGQIDDLVKYASLREKGAVIMLHVVFRCEAYDADKNVPPR